MTYVKCEQAKLTRTESAQGHSEKESLSEEGKRWLGLRLDYDGHS